MLGLLAHPTKGLFKSINDRNKKSVKELVESIRLSALTDLKTDPYSPQTNTIVSTFQRLLDS